MKVGAQVIVSPEFQAILGQIVSRWAHLEEQMIMFMGTLLADEHVSPARQIFRSVNSTQARIAIMRSLLEESMHNRDKGVEFDEIIDEFESLTKERNNYVHGLWWTDDANGAVSRADPAIIVETMPFLKAKPVSIKQAQHVLNRMNQLSGRIVTVWGTDLRQRVRRRL
jgi:hypothetical protein